MTTFIEGGVTAAKGFQAAGVHCGIRKNRAKKDLGLIVSDRPASAAAVYTRNLVKGAPLTVTQAHIADGRARAIVCNSGIANTCAFDGIEKAEAMCALTAEALGIDAADVVVASTGVIGPSIDIAPIAAGLPRLAAALSAQGSADAAEAIMTTDTRKKEFAVTFQADGRTCTLGGIAKGSGMIAPNMATMLCFLTTDAAIAPQLLHEALLAVVDDTFNMLSVDGDTSTNDMCAVLANGMAGNPLIEWKDDGYTVFLKALRQLCQELARAIAGDGEGASRLITCAVREARSEESAERLAKAVVGSPLVKAAMFGADANWGRVLCAMGYSKAPFRPEYVDISFSSAVGAVAVCRGGMGLDFDEEAARSILSQDEVVIDVHLHEGEHEATCWGCDLTYEYVKINGDYRT